MKKIWVTGLLAALVLVLAAGGLWYSRQKENSSPFYIQHGRILHACGGIDENRYTNSAEALEQTLAKKCDSVEIDFSFTSDGVLVCNHGWKDFKREAPDLKTFLETETIGGLTPQTAEEALARLIRAENTWLVLDTQDEDVPAVYAEVVRICRDLGGESFLKKIVPQIYDESEYEPVRELFPFRQWIFTLYKLDMESLRDYEEITDFCREHKIGMITMDKDRVSEEICALIHKRGIRVAAHTINSAKREKKLRKMGADAIYTDFLYYDE